MPPFGTALKMASSAFEPGAGGDFKRLRGFDPQPTVSMHYLADPRLHEAVSNYLVRERDHTDQAIDWMWEESQLKHTPTEKTFVYGSLDIESPQKQTKSEEA